MRRKDRSRRPGWIVTATVGLGASCSVLSPSGSRVVPVAGAGESGCGQFSVEAGRDRIAWRLTAHGEAAFLQDPVGMGDGFLVSSFDCTAYLEADGRIRWTIPSGAKAAARVDDTVVLAGARPGVLGLDAATGKRSWTHSVRGLVASVAAGDGVVLVASSGFGPAVEILSGDDGRPVGKGRRGDGSFRSALSDDGLLVAAGVARPADRGAVVIADDAGRIVLDTEVSLYSPEPRGVSGDVVVIQSDGSAHITPTRERTQPSTHLEGIHRIAGKRLWRRELPGERAAPAVVIGDVAVVRIEDALMAIDARSGRTRWMQDRSGDPAGLEVRAGDHTLALSAGDGTVELLEAASGERRWTTKLDGAVERLAPLDGDTLFAATAAGTYAEIRLGDGTLAWSASSDAFGTASVGTTVIRAVVVQSGLAVTNQTADRLLAIVTGP